MTTATLPQTTLPRPLTAARPTRATMTVQQKADQLFSMGYRCRLTEAGLIVRNPEGREYLCDPRRQTCTCPATREACCHLLGATRLAMQQAEAHCWRAMSMDDTTEECRQPGNPNAYTDLGMDLRRRSLRLEDRAQSLFGWIEAQEGRAA